jgi:hypothetical protein
MSELPDDTDSLNEMADLKIDTDSNDIAISQNDEGRRNSGPEIINSDDDLMSLQSELRQNDSDAELPGSDSLENALSFLNLQEDSDLAEISDSEIISSGDSLMFLQNEDSAEDSADTDQQIGDVVLQQGEDLDDLISTIAEEQNNAAVDELSFDQENAEPLLQSVELENSGFDNARSEDVEVYPVMMIYTVIYPIQLIRWKRQSRNRR